MQWSLAPKLTEVATAAVSLQDAKDHLRIRDSRHDSQIASKLLQATAFCQAWQGRKYLNDATLVQSFAAWPERIILHAAPFIAVSKIQTSDGTIAAIMSSSVYAVSIVNGVGIVKLANGQTWPTLTDENIEHKVQVYFTAGYGATVDTVPPLIRAAILFMTEHLFEQTAPVAIGATVSELPLGIASILDMEKVHYPEMVTA